MSKTVIEKLQTEIERANEVTGKTDSNLHSAIGNLIEGYGQGSNFLELSIYEISVSSDCNTPVTIYSDSNWEIINDADWIEISQTSGKSTTTVDFRAKSSGERQCTIIIKNSSKTVELLVFQKDIEYIYSKNTASFLKTNIHFDNSTKIEIKFLYSSLNATISVLFGSRTGGNNDGLWMMINGSTNIGTVVCGTERTEIGKLVADSIYILTIDIVNKFIILENLTLETVKQFNNIKVGNISSNYDSNILCFNEGGANTYIFKPYSRVYYFKVYKDDELVNCLLPTKTDDGYSLVDKTGYAKVVISDNGKFGGSDEVVTLADYEDALIELGV